MKALVEINLTPNSTGEVKLDGQVVRGVYRVELTGEVSKPTNVVLHLIGAAVQVNAVANIEVVVK